MALSPSSAEWVLLPFEPVSELALGADDEIDWLDVLVFSKAPHLMQHYYHELAPLLYTCRDARNSTDLLRAVAGLHRGRYGRTITLYAEVTRDAQLLASLTTAGLPVPTTARVDRHARLQAKLRNGIKKVDAKFGKRWDGDRMFGVVHDKLADEPRDSLYEDGEGPPWDQGLTEEADERLSAWMDHHIGRRAVPILLLLRDLGVARSAWNPDYFDELPRLKDGERDDADGLAGLEEVVEEAVRGEGGYPPMWFDRPAILQLTLALSTRVSTADGTAVAPHNASK